MPRGIRKTSDTSFSIEGCNPTTLKDDMSSIRIQFWMNAWLAYCQRQTVNIDGAKRWADKALEDFDVTFGGGTPQVVIETPVFHQPQPLPQKQMVAVVSHIARQVVGTPFPETVPSAFGTSEEVSMSLPNR